MDPSTTLMTFMLEIFITTKAVSLVGSWDNFSARYALERDIRRGRGQWRGCYAFQNIICDGERSNSTTRNGGLKMGHTYWYYYELDDGTEIYDKSLPYTTACPYLPGQPVNLLSVPIQRTQLRDRSASEGTCLGEFQTLRPQDKFIAPRAVPPMPKLTRLETSSGAFGRDRSARSVSPRQGRPQWSSRGFFGKKGPVSAAETRVASPDPWDLWEERGFPGSHCAETATSQVPDSQKSNMRSQDYCADLLQDSLNPPPSHSFHLLAPPTRAAPVMPSTLKEPRLPSREAPPPPFAQQQLLSIGSQGMSKEDCRQLSKASPPASPANISTTLLMPPVSAGTSFRHSTSSRRRSPLSFVFDTVKDRKSLPISATNTTVSQSFSSTPPFYAESRPSVSQQTSLVTALTLPDTNDWPLPNHAGFADRKALHSIASPNSQSLNDTISAGHPQPIEAHSTQFQSSPSSVCELTDDDDEGGPSISANSSRLSRMNPWSKTPAWQGYSLPLEDTSSDLTIKVGPRDLKEFHAARNRRDSPAEPDRLANIDALREALRKAFEADGNENREDVRDSLFLDLGYLGEMIVA